MHVGRKTATTHSAFFKQAGGNGMFVLWRDGIYEEELPACGQTLPDLLAKLDTWQCSAEARCSEPKAAAKERCKERSCEGRHVCGGCSKLHHGEVLAVCPMCVGGLAHADAGEAGEVHEVQQTSIEDAGSRIGQSRRVVGQANQGGGGAGWENLERQGRRRRRRHVPCVSATRSPEHKEECKESRGMLEQTTRMGLPSEEIQKARERRDKIPLPSENQLPKDQKASVSEKPRLREPHQKVEKECDEKEEALQKEDFARKASLEQNWKKSSRKNWRRYEGKAGFTSRRRRKGVRRTTSFKEALGSRLQDGQPYSIAAAAETGDDNPAIPSAVPLQGVGRLHWVAGVPRSRVASAERLLQTLVAAPATATITKMQAKTIAEVVCRLMSNVAVDSDPKEVAMHGAGPPA